MKIVNFVVNPENISDTLNTFTMAISNHTEHIENLSKNDKRLAISVICLSVAGFLTYRYITKQANRINELEKTVDTLVQIAVGKNSKEQQPESE